MSAVSPEEIRCGLAHYEQWRKENMADKVIQHKQICDELNKLYERKNHDYGDSFHQTFAEEGLAMARIRLGDKLNRFKTLSKLPPIMPGEAKVISQKVTDESMRDTLLDLANYAIMTVMEMDGDMEVKNDT